MEKKEWKESSRRLILVASVWWSAGWLSFYSFVFSTCPKIWTLLFFNGKKTMQNVLLICLDGDQSRDPGDSWGWRQGHQWKCCAKAAGKGGDQGFLLVHRARREGAKPHLLKVPSPFTSSHWGPSSQHIEPWGQTIPKPPHCVCRSGRRERWSSWENLAIEGPGWLAGRLALAQSLCLCCSPVGATFLWWHRLQGTARKHIFVSIPLTSFSFCEWEGKLK